MQEKQLKTLEQVLKSDIDFLEKIRAISDTIKALVQADRCTIFIHDSTSNSFWSAYIEGISYIELPDTMGIVHDVFHKNQMLIFNNVQKNPEFHREIDSSTGYVTRSMMAAPILDYSKRPIGVIQVLNKLGNDGRFATEDKQVLAELIHYIHNYTDRLKS